MNLSRVIIVSDRHLFDREADPEAAFLSYLERIATEHPRAVLLQREGYDRGGLPCSRKARPCTASFRTADSPLLSARGKGTPL